MPELTLSFEDLEALHDVLEAARCYWHSKPEEHMRAAETLRLANRLYWNIGEHLPLTGTPSRRFREVKFTYSGGRVDQLLRSVIDLTREYAVRNDPWRADTVFASSGLTDTLSQAEIDELRASLRRLSLTLEIRSEIQNSQMIAARQDLGPWYEQPEEPAPYG